jgi:iron complex outermembrane receptor protein/hemoglobin/transferrin/lactoferrin receptor protein
VACAALVAAARPASAQAPPPSPAAAAPAAPPSAEAAPAEPAPVEVTVRARRADADAPTTGRSSTSVTRRELEERMPRSAPDALRYEPGVFVQQTAHGQASAFLRGRTGQQTVVLFDGIRLNTSTWRQGPNQYFFTVDTYSVQRLDVVRGGASTQYGSDALGGVIDAIPVEPRLDDGRGLVARPRVFARWASADASFGQRFQLDTQLGDRVQVLAGVGYQRVGELRSGGPVTSPVTGEQALVPVFEDDGKTQHGTGYKELTADARVVYRLSPTRKLTAAAYLFREYDAPRTDQCPAPKAPLGECLTVNEQFRTLTYASYDGDLGPIAEHAKIALSYQRQHEKRTLHRVPPADVDLVGRDDVDTFGLTAKATTPWAAIARFADARLHYGGDAYLDRVDSSAFMTFRELDVTIKQSRGQYLSGSSYVQGGAFALGEVAFADGAVVVRGGGRGGGARASSPEDPESGTKGVKRSFPLFSATGGAEWRALEWLSVLANVDRSVRAPNLDDLTSRQQTGPGFQFENPDLVPEVGTTFEAGLRFDHRYVTIEGWVYRALLEHAMTRGVRSESDCPPSTPQCNASKRRVELVNVAGLATITGTELWAKLRWPNVATLTATLSYAYGVGPSPSAPDDPNAPREPLSRVPPLNGTVDARVGRRDGPFGGAGLRWATEQTRLSTTDYGDARIPRFGTPGFAVLDLRAGWRFGREMVAALVVENVADTAYRTHGSAINGPGRGVILSFEAGL